MVNDVTDGREYTNELIPEVTVRYDRIGGKLVLMALDNDRMDGEWRQATAYEESAILYDPEYTHPAY